MSAHVVVGAAAGITALAVLVGIPRGGDDPTACPRVLMPAYAPPDRVARAAGETVRSGMVVINPANGPGRAAHPAYRRAVEVAHANGLQVLGYVATRWGRRRLSDVTAEAAHHAAWYGTDGVFLDEAASAPEEVDVYREMTEGVASVGADIVVLNPGVVPAPGYFGIADAVVTYEGPLSTYRAAQEQSPAWLSEVPASRIAHLVYDVPPGRIGDVLRLARHAGYVYATTGVPPNPWRVLTSGPQELGDDPLCGP